MRFGIGLRSPNLALIDGYLDQMQPSGALRHISHFEINYVSPNLGYDWREAYLEGVKLRVLEHRLTTSIHFPSFNLSEVNLRIQEVIIQEFREMLAYGKQINTRHIVVHPGYLDYYETPKIMDKTFISRMEDDLQSAFAYSASMLRTLNAIAAEHGMVILIENLPLPRSITKNCNDLRNLREMGPGDTVKFVFDTGHSHLTGNNLYDNIVCLGDDLIEIHAHDNNVVYDQHRIPGTGTIRWETFKQGLGAIGFSGVLLIELNDCSLEAITQAARFLENLFDIGR